MFLSLDNNVGGQEHILLKDKNKDQVHVSTSYQFLIIAGSLTDTTISFNTGITKSIPLIQFLVIWPTGGGGQELVPILRHL